MNNFKHLKNILNYTIKKLDDVSSLFAENPETDFARYRKLDFEIVMKSIICMKLGF